MPKRTAAVLADEIAAKKPEALLACYREGGNIMVEFEGAPLPELAFFKMLIEGRLHASIAGSMAPPPPEKPRIVTL